MATDALSPLGSFESAQRLVARASSAQKITYDDPSGKSFTLDLSRVTTVRHETYDRRGQVNGLRGEAARGANGSAMLDDLRSMAEAARRLFEKLSREAGFAPPSSGALEELHVEVLQIQDSLTLDMNVVDTEFWSVENTAKRIADFGKSLFAGGDRGEHLDKMLAGIEQGFQEAKAAFGGFLPDISSQTADLAKEMLRDWATEDAATPGVDAVA